MFDLRFKTPPEWLEVVFADFDSFLLDHAACERKAAATGMSFVVRYPDKSELIEPMIEFAREELEHFQIMYRIVHARGLILADDYKDPYVNALRSRVRNGGLEMLLDKLLVAGIVEARGCERLFMVAEALREQSSPLAEPYLDLARAEARHHGLFFRLARAYFDDAQIDERAATLLDYEAELVRRLPHRAAVH
ncbi:MAG TPA: tRNA-(ms[2]io[6]A)-hydroxylase [Polyangiaceae bacterium]|jgi:tRNA-(ms[2]io[6]A)-hydroxylase|nr:tRNA-(ms[2]io[6]A)-hydroxylase [Polyangiaceae bacterium]